MRALIVVAAAALSSFAPSRAAAQADPLPLHPGVTGVVLQPWPGRVWIESVLPGSPAEAAGLVGGGEVELLAVNGRPVAEGARTALVGPLGSALEVTVRRRGGECRTLRLERADLLAPGPGYTGTVVTRRFVVHHRRTPEDTREARALARDAERRYARSRFPRDTEGRRAHLWLADHRFLPHREAWASASRYQPGSTGMVEAVFGYLAYGDPGHAARAFDSFGAEPQTRQVARWHHQASARRILESRRMAATPGAEPHMVAPTWRSGHRSMSFSWGSTESASLRHYVIERFGEARFRRLWGRDDDLADAVPRTLGVSMETLLRDWGRYVVTLGPDPDAGPEPGAAAVTLASGALALLLGVRAVRRKEVGG